MNNDRTDKVERERRRRESHHQQLMETMDDGNNSKEDNYTHQQDKPKEANEAENKLVHHNEAACDAKFQQIHSILIYITKELGSIKALIQESSSFIVHPTTSDLPQRPQDVLATNDRTTSDLPQRHQDVLETNDRIPPNHPTVQSPTIVPHRMTHLVESSQDPVVLTKPHKSSGVGQRRRSMRSTPPEPNNSCDNKKTMKSTTNEPIDVHSIKLCTGVNTRRSDHQDRSDVSCGCVANKYGDTDTPCSTVTMMKDNDNIHDDAGGCVTEKPLSDGFRSSSRTFQSENTDETLLDEVEKFSMSNESIAIKKAYANKRKRRIMEKIKVMKRYPSLFKIYPDETDLNKTSRYESNTTLNKEQMLANRKKNMESVLLNVGGKRHEVTWKTLDKFPNSRLGRLRICQTDVTVICGKTQNHIKEYYFDRSPRHFDAILSLYRTGKLHLTPGVCIQDFSEELEYWGLCELQLSPCCLHTYYRTKWLLPTQQESDVDEAYFPPGFWGTVQKKMWNLVENPNSSFAAKVVALVSCLFVIASTLTLIFSTLPSFQNDDDEEDTIFVILEAIFVGWFTFEYLIRLISAPDRWTFVKSGMNVLDVVGIMPYYLSLFLSVFNKSTGGSPNAGSTFQDEMQKIAQIFRIMRILRIFKLVRHITGLQTLGFTLKNSYKELGLLVIVVIMGMLIFSGLAYVSERNVKDTTFISMPQALYWAIITMTSVGYGDIYPKTWFGKLVGSGCAICGVLCISLPIPIVVNNFNRFYERVKIEEQIEQRKLQFDWIDAKEDLRNARLMSCAGDIQDYKSMLKGQYPVICHSQQPSLSSSSFGYTGQQQRMVNEINVNPHSLEEGSHSSQYKSPAIISERGVMEVGGFNQTHLESSQSTMLPTQQSESVSNKTEMELKHRNEYLF